MENTFSKDRNTVYKYIAFFDLDRTITKAISGNALARAAFKSGLVKRTGLIHALYLSLVFKLNFKDQLKIIDEMVTWVQGMSEKTMVDLCSKVFHKVLLPSIYTEARSEIKFHKEKNAKVVILSSALKPICREMAKNLLMDDIICSDLEVYNGYLTGQPRGHICFGNEKTLRLKDYCEKNNTEASTAWYYADSISDLSALSCVGNPVCINPDKRLKKAALRKSWKILWWNS